MGYVDETSGLAIDDEGLQVLAYRFRAVIDLLWERHHSGKMKLLSLDVKCTSVTRVRSTVTWGSDTVESVKKYGYVKFLGGNANPVGGVAKVRRVIKAACRLVIGKLRNWPTSLQIAHAILPGLVVCKLVFQCIVNIPAEAHLFNMFGMICRAYRVVFGIPYRTPRQCLFKCLGVPSQEHVFWATALHEQYKAFCIPSPVLCQASWVHWQRSVLHHLDQDAVRLRALTDAIGIHFRCLSRCEALKWSLTVPSHYPSPLVLSVFGDASQKRVWGGAARVQGALGRIWLDESVTLDGHAISTKVMKGLMLAQGIVAIRDAINDLHVLVRLMWSWSDCLSAVQSLCSAALTMRPGHIFDRVVAAGNVAGVLQRWGWFSTQHDSNLKDWLSEVNAEMDANAKWASDGHARSVVVLSMWLDGSSVLPVQGEKVIVHLKKFVQESDLLGFLGDQKGATRGQGVAERFSRAHHRSPALAASTTPSIGALGSCSMLVAVLCHT